MQAAGLPARGMDRSTLVRALALAGVVGGAFWVAKGASILATGAQPPLLFEVAPVGLSLSLVGLHLALAPAPDLAARAGGVVARIAVALSGAAAVAFVVAEDALSGESSFSALSLLPFASLLATILALVLLGVAARRVDFPTRRWRSLPLALGISIVPGVVLAGAVLGLFHERLLEVPIVAVGAGWALLNALVWRSQA